MSKDGGPAFPVTTPTMDSRGIPFNYIEHGMSLRDYFAAAAMKGIIASFANIENQKMVVEEANIQNIHPKARVSIAAYEYADAMLAERDKR